MTFDIFTIFIPNFIKFILIDILDDD